MSPHIDPKAVFIIVPVYNEKESGSVISELYNKGYTVVVVDDGSETDVITDLNNFPVYILQHAVNLGQGAAIQTGIEFALEQNASFIVTFDADGQHQVADIEKLLAIINSNEIDVALGSRFISGGSHNMGSGRKMLLQVARWFNYLLTGLLLTDAHNGLRALNRKAAGLIRITQYRMAHATELLTEIKKNKLRYKEVPVTIKYTEYSKRKGQSVWGSFRIFFDLLLDKIFK